MLTGLWGDWIIMTFRPTLLVVDDDAIIRMDTIEQFEKTGFRVLEAENADDAVAVLSAEPDIRIVFSDIQMPGIMDGVGLCSYVRKTYPPLIIILCSGQVRPDLNSLPEGVQFFRKPISPEMLAQTAEHLHQRLAS